MRRPPTPTTLLLVTLTLGLLSVAGPSAAHTDQGPDHIHVHLSLGDDSETEAVESADAFTFRMQGSLVVQEDPTGAGRHTLRFPLPDDADVLDFGPEDPSNGHVSSADGDAVFTWDASVALAPGTVVHNVTLVAVRVVDPTSPFTVRWHGLHPDNTTARLELPNGYTITSGRQLLPQTAHAPAGRKVWSQIDLATSSLEVNVRATYEGADPAFSDPPNPLGGFLVVLGIGLVSGGAWVLGKRMEARHKHAEEDEAAATDQDPTRS